MSRRNSPEQKRLRRVRRELSKGRLDTKIDLIEWVKARSSVTSGMAEKIILSGALRVDSHPVGRVETPKGARVQRYVSSNLNDRIQIMMPKELQND